MLSKIMDTRIHDLGKKAKREHDDYHGLSIKELLNKLCTRNKVVRIEIERELEKRVRKNHIDMLIHFLSMERTKCTYMLDVIIVLLGKLKAKKAIPVIATYLQDTREILRMSAVQELGNIGSKRAIPFILKAFDDPNAFVFLFACYSLINIGDRSVAKHIEERLAKSKTNWDKLCLTQALCMLGDVGRVQDILGFLNMGTNRRLSYIRKNAAQFLVDISNTVDLSTLEIIIQGLNSALEREKEKNVKDQILWSIDSILDQKN